MADEKKKIYCGNAKIVTTKYGDVTKISMNRTDIQKLLDYMDENNTEWANLETGKKRETQNSFTHYVQVDTWKPDKDKQPEKPAPEQSDDLPY